MEYLDSSPSFQRRVIIIGAGIMGCCTAFYLCTKYGIKPIIIEAVAPGSGASGKAGGFLACEWEIGNPLEELARLSYSLHSELAVFLRENYEVEVHHRHVEAWAITINGNRSTPSPQRDSINWPDWLDGNVSFAKTWQRRQHKSGVLGSLDTGKTAQIHPKRLLDGLLKACIACGSELKIGRVVDLVSCVAHTKSREAGKAGLHPLREFSHVVLDTGEEIYGDFCVLAMGPWTFQAQQWVSIPEITSERYHSITIHPRVRCNSPHCLFASWKESKIMKDCEIYVRPDNEVYVLGMPDDEPLPETAGLVKPLQTSADSLKEYAGRFSTILAESDIAGTQACYLPLSQDALPIMGLIPGMKNSCIVAGHCQWGILLGPGSGLAMAELIAEGSSKSVDAERFSPLRFGRRGIKLPKRLQKEDKMSKDSANSR